MPSTDRIDPAEPEASSKIGSPRKPSVYVVGACDVPVWRLSTIERLRRSFGSATVSEIRQAPAPAPTLGRVVVLRADLVYDPAIFATLTTSSNLLVDAAVETGPSQPVASVVDARDAAWAISMLAGEPPHADPPMDLRRRTVDQLDAAHRQALRKREPPYVLRLDPSTRTGVEWRIFQGAYKGVTDAVTKYLWPVPAFHVTRFCARLGLTPNAVTAVSLLLVVGATLAFWQGQFLLGLAMAWPMTFLDTVDGKLARVTLTSSRFGNVFDHGIDLVHPPFWYVAWAVGLGAMGMALPTDLLTLSLAVIVGGYVLGRLIEGLFILLHGIEIHVWRRLDSRFRLITARRNPNLVLLTATAVAGRPDIGVLAIAAWTAISLLFHVGRLAMATAASRREGSLRSWLSEPVEPELTVGA